MELRNFYLSQGNSKNTNMAAGASKSMGFLAVGMFCMLLTMFSANKAHAQSTTRSSKVYAATSPFQDSLWTFTMPDGQIIKRLHPTLTGFTITGINGLATDPTNGDQYTILKLTGVSGRMLAKINIQTGVCTQVGNLGDNFSTISFNANGSLFGVTGDGATVPETMYRINKADGTKSLFRTLGNGADGEVIVYNTDDNKFYHWSGNGTVVWERFDTSGTDVIENLTYSGAATGGETFGGIYLGGGLMMMSNISSEIHIWNVATGNIGATIMNTPDDFRGMVSETHVSSIDAGSATSICPGTSVTLSVTGGTGGYQWYHNGASISGANSVSYAAEAAGIYNCIYADVNGIIDSPATGIAVTIKPQPAIVVAANPSVCYGTSSTGITFSTLTDHTYTGTANSYFIPAGVTSVTFDIAGAAGGNDSSSFPAPGKGGRLQGTLAVTAGDVLTVNVGGAGAHGSITGAMGGYNGGGNSFGFGGSGGGATDIRLNGTALVQRVAVAGGGAGSGYNSDLSVSVPGGVGGATTAGDGGANFAGGFAAGGSAVAGGNAASVPFITSGSVGTPGAGGDGAPSLAFVSGGGAGGYFGGGGGAASGGGGGSSYSDATLVTSVSHTQGFNDNHGYAKISFGVPSGYTYSINWDAAALTAGFTDVAATAFPTSSSSFPVTIPGTATPATYNGFLTINDGTCDYTQAISVEVKPIPNVVATADQPAVCNGTNTTTVAFSGSYSGTVYNWTSSLATVGIPTSGAGNIPAFTAFNSSSVVKIDTIIVTPSLNGCFGTPDTFTYTVKPTPTLTGGSSAGYVCDNAPFNYTATSAVAGTTFAWSRPPLTGDIVAAANNGTASISETFDNTGANPVAVTYTYTLTANGCDNQQFLTVTVNPTPVLSPTPLVGTSCSGDVVTFGQTSATIGLLHSWSRAAVTGITPATGTGSGLISEVLTNTTASPITVVYVDTMNINGCKNTENLTVIVNPMPVLTSSLTGNICDNASFNYKAKSATTGVSFAWERGVIAGIANSSNDGSDTISELLDNTTFVPVTVTYAFSLSANGCTNFQNVLVTVNPTPSLSTTLTPAAICDSTTFDYTPASTTPGATFAWTRAAVPNITNPAASGTGNPNERLRNASPLPVVVTYVYTTGINGCTNAENVLVTVNPKPRLSNTMPSPICDSTVFNFTPASFTPGFTYTWSRAFVAGIGSLPVVDATGNISELLKNNTNGNLQVTYAFTLSANGCVNLYNVPLVVRPTPKLSSTLNDSACSGAPFTYNPTTDLTVPVTYAWARAQVTNITPATSNGTGTASETLVNGTTGIINVSYVYTISVGGGCAKTEIVKVRVRPSADAPVIGTMPPAALCNGVMYQNFGAAIPAPTGITYSWSTNNAELYATGTGNQYSLVNFTTPGTAEVTLTAKVGATGCIGVTTYKVTVGNTASTMPKVIYTKGKFICLQNDVKNFQWGYDDANTLDSVILKGEINQSYFNAAPQFANRKYWVMTSTGDCSSKAYYNTPADNTPKDINETEEAFTDMQVYPNPANDQINVEVRSATTGNVHVELVNMLGQMINTVKTDNNKASFSISNLPAGFYMVECYQDGIKVGTAKFVKN
jgi:hypothetical protein